MKRPAGCDEAPRSVWQFFFCEAWELCRLLKSSLLRLAMGVATGHVKDEVPVYIKNRTKQIEDFTCSAVLHLILKAAMVSVVIQMAVVSRTLLVRDTVEVWAIQQLRYWRINTRRQWRLSSRKTLKLLRFR